MKTQETHDVISTNEQTCGRLSGCGVLLRSLSLSHSRQTTQLVRQRSCVRIILSKSGVNRTPKPSEIPGKNWVMERRLFRKNWGQGAATAGERSPQIRSAITTRFESQGNLQRVNARSHSNRPFGERKSTQINANSKTRTRKNNRSKQSRNN